MVRLSERPYPNVARAAVGEPEARELFRELGVQSVHGGTEPGVPQRQVGAGRSQEFPGERVQGDGHRLRFGRSPRCRRPPDDARERPHDESDRHRHQ